MKQNLNEEINRIKTLLYINESNVILEANPFLTMVSRLGPALEARFITHIETKLTKKIADATDAEITTALKSAEMATIRKEIADAIYLADKTTIDAILSRYNMSVPGEAAKAYNELSAQGYNRAILKDINKTYKENRASAGTGAGTSAGANSNTGSQIFNMGGGLNINNLPDPIGMDVDAITARLKNMFPKASTKQISKMVENLKVMKITDSSLFEKAFTEAVTGFKPIYDEILRTPSNRVKVIAQYNKMSNWQKRIFWIVITPIGYEALKSIGVPVDKTLSFVWEGWKRITSDQFKDGSTSSGGSTNNTGGKGRFN
jgi:hypothetical protein